MILCRITGDVVSTVKHEKFHGHRIMVVQPVELDARTRKGGSFLALDLVQAGVGDLVLAIVEGSGVRLIFGDETIPLSAVITAIVDEMDVTDPATLVGVSALEQARAAGEVA